MLLNCYVLVDKVSTRMVKVVFACTDGELVRNNIPVDCRSDQNPAGLPFQDVEYRCVGTFDTDTFVLSSSDIRTVDILKSYNFKIENPVKDLDKKNNKGDE